MKKAIKLLVIMTVMFIGLQGVNAGVVSEIRCTYINENAELGNGWFKFTRKTSDKVKFESRFWGGTDGVVEYSSVENVYDFYDEDYDEETFGICPEYLLFINNRVNDKSFIGPSIASFDNIISEEGISEGDSKGDYRIYKFSTEENVNAGLSTNITPFSIASTEQEEIAKREADSSTIVVDSSNDNPCSTLIGDNTIGIIQELYKYLKILVPMIIILMGTLDFIKVVTIGKEEDMKKAQSNFIKRIVVGIVFFIVPVLVSVILKISGITEAYDFGSKDSDAIFCIFINE